MRKLYVFFILSICSVVFLSGSASAQQVDKTQDLESLIAEALKNNPQIKSAESLWQAAINKAPQVSALPDPVLGYTRFGESVETRVGPQENIFSISQKIPFPGKLGLKSEAAKQDALVAQQAYLAVKRDIAFNVKQAYFDLFWIDKSTKILNDYLILLKDFTKVAEQKYATGQGIQTNVLKSQVEMSTTLNRKFDFDKLRQSAVSKINVLLNRPQSQPLGLVSKIDSVANYFDEETLTQRALEQKQELAAIKAKVEKSETMRKLAKKDYLPDFNFQFNYIDVSKGKSNAPEAGKDAWSVMVSLNLPLWFGKRKAAVRAANSTLVANRFAFENQENQVKSEIHDLFYQIEIARKSLALYEQGLLTQAESSLQSAISSYKTGNLDFISLLDSERMLLNLNLSYVKEQSNFHKKIAGLERAMGGDLKRGQR